MHKRRQCLRKIVTSGKKILTLSKACMRRPHVYYILMEAHATAHAWIQSIDLQSAYSTNMKTYT